MPNSKDHNFEKIEKSLFFNDKGLMMNKWLCSDCDSMFAYPVEYTWQEVNSIINKSNFKCLPPVGEDNAEERKLLS